MVDSSRSGMYAAAAIAKVTLGTRTQAELGAMARVSHIAALAAERLASSTADAATIPEVLLMLREIQNEGHLTYLRQHGTDADYQKIGAKVRGRFQTPSGRWRKRGSAEPGQ